MDAAAAYLAERSRLKFELAGVKENNHNIRLDNKNDGGLPDGTYSEPLTFSVAANTRLIGFEGPITSVMNEMNYPSRCLGEYLLC